MLSTNVGRVVDNLYGLVTDFIRIFSKSITGSTFIYMLWKSTRLPLSSKQLWMRVLRWRREDCDSPTWFADRYKKVTDLPPIDMQLACRSSSTDQWSLEYYLRDWIRDGLIPQTQCGRFLIWGFLSKLWIPKIWSVERVEAVEIRIKLTDL